jgi:lipoprotein-anchoring transpeptidase ErfK/SrfK
MVQVSIIGLMAGLIASSIPAPELLGNEDLFPRVPQPTPETPVVSPSMPVSPSPAPANVLPTTPPVAADRRIEISLSRRRLTLFQGRQALKTYPVAVGKSGWQTPLGQFQVRQMFENPPWRNPFTGVVIPGGTGDNPLGRRWIGFWTDGKNWVGMHGTPKPSSVGQAASHGCIRMFNRDIEELFTKVAIGTPVKVVK